MKVLITSDWYVTAINGVVTSILNLKRSLEARGHDVKILTINTSHKSDKKENDIYALGSISIEKIYPNLRTTVRIHSHLVQELIDWHPDVIHSNCEFTTFTIAKHISHACHVPVVHTYHTVYEDYTHYFCPSKRLGKALVKDFTKFISDHVDIMIAPTTKVAKMLREYGVETAIEVLPTGINLEKFKETPSELWIKEKRQELDIKDNQHIVLYLGRLAKEKNIDELIQAATRFPSEYVLVIVGGGPDYERLVNIKNQLNASNVIFTGMVPPEETNNYYHLGEVFTSASTSETQGLTYFEALASGLPVVCIKDDCLEGVVINGYNGYQCDSTVQLADTIMFSMKNNISDMSTKAKLTAQRFSTETFGEDAEKIYEEAIQHYAEDREKKLIVRMKKDMAEFAQKLKSIFTRFH